MNPFAVIFAICCLASARARPTYSHGKEYLEGVPNDSHFSKLSYPKFDIIHLGSAIKDTLPPAVVQITKKVIVKEPHPYPVKVPVPVPHPVEIPKPYPVFQTKIVKVPHAVPVEVVKNIPVHIEVPKPYPVPHEEFKPSDGYGGSFGGHAQEINEEFKAPEVSAPVASYGNSFGGHEHLGLQEAKDVHEESQEGDFGGGYGGGFDGGDGGYAQADQSSNYGAQVHPEHPTGWVPLSMGQTQQMEEQQQ